jgi:hypothetical protein
LKITFEATYFVDIVTEMQNFLSGVSRQTSTAGTQEVIAAGKYQFPGPVEAAPVDNPVENSVENPVENPVDTSVEVSKPERSEKRIDARKNVADKQKAAAKMRAAKEAKKAAREAAAAAPIVQGMPMPPPPKSAEGMDPAEVAKIRIKTIEELQTAYANGYQKEVFELLARFGNGAKSFREVPVEAFVPIREAIDNGALT